MVAAAAWRSARKCGNWTMPAARPICGSSGEVGRDGRSGSVLRVGMAMTSVCDDVFHRAGSQLRSAPCS